MNSERLGRCRNDDTGQPAVEAALCSCPPVAYVSERPVRRMRQDRADAWPAFGGRSTCCAARGGGAQAARRLCPSRKCIARHELTRLDALRPAHYFQGMTLRMPVAWVMHAALAGLAALGCGQVAAGASEGAGGSPGTAGQAAGGSAGAAAGTAGDAGRPALVDPNLPWDSALPFAKSGDRLQALGYVANSVEQFRSMHDALLDFDCEFAPDAAGSGLRCVPRAQTDIIYLDPNCSQPAAWNEYDTIRMGETVSARPAQPGFVCPNTPGLHRETFDVGEQVYAEWNSSKRTPVYEHSGVKCMPTFPQVKGLPAVQRLIPRSESTLVAAKRVITDVGSGLRLSRIIAEDGAQVTVAVMNAAQQPCAVQPDGECIPGILAIAGSGDYFVALDAACTEPAFSSPFADACGKPELGIEGTSGDTFRVHQLKAAPLFAKRFVLDDHLEVDPLATTCEHAIPGEFSAFALDRDVTGAYPMAQPLRRGTRDLHVDWFVTKASAGSLVVPIARVQESPQFLNALGHLCQVTPSVDGSLRCAAIEPQAFEDTYWADPACTKPLYRSYPPGQDPATLHRAEYDPDGTRLTGLWTVKAYPGAVYGIVNNQCSKTIPLGTTLTLDQRTDVSALPQVVEQPL